MIQDELDMEVVFRISRWYITNLLDQKLITEYQYQCAMEYLEKNCNNVTHCLYWRLGETQDDESSKTESR